MCYYIFGYKESSVIRNRISRNKLVRINLHYYCYNISLLFLNNFLVMPHLHFLLLNFDTRFRFYLKLFVKLSLEYKRRKISEHELRKINPCKWNINNYYTLRLIIMHSIMMMILKHIKKRGSQEVQCLFSTKIEKRITRQNYIKHIS